MSALSLLQNRSRLGQLVLAIVWVLTVRIGLTVLSMKAVRRAFMPKEVTGELDPDAAEEVIWSVKRAAKIVPFASCLTQAMASQIMLARRNYPSVLHVGARRAEDGTFTAHAWLEGGGMLLIGGTRAYLAAFVQLAQYSAHQ